MKRAARIKRGFRATRVFQDNLASSWGFCAALLVSVLLGAVAPVLAHHSFAMYEPTKTLTFDATVKSFQWTNPHVIVAVLVQPEGGGAAQEWSIQTGSPGVLKRAGWTPRSVNAGDRVSVTFFPLRDGSQGGDLKSMTLQRTGQILLPSSGKELKADPAAGNRSWPSPAKAA